MQTVYLEGNLAKFGHKWETSCDTIADVFKLIECQTPGLRKHLVDAHEAGIEYQVKRGKELIDIEECFLTLHDDDIIITELPAGSKGIGKVLAANDIVAFASDKRLKENIIEISNPLDKIQQVRGVYFDWNQKSKEKGFKAAREKNEIGMIAQEVEQIIPQAIEPAPFNKEYKTIKYDRLIPLLVECIKDQQKQIDELKSKIN